MQFFPAVAIYLILELFLLYLSHCKQFFVFARSELFAIKKWLQKAFDSKQLCAHVRFNWCILTASCTQRLSSPICLRYCLILFSFKKRTWRKIMICNGQIIDSHVLSYLSLYVRNPQLELAPSFLPTFTFIPTKPQSKWGYIFGVLPTLPRLGT